MSNQEYVPIFRGNGVLEYVERDAPQIETVDDVLVQIEACGICGTDLNILAVPPAHKAPPGIVIGHEGVGIVKAIGPAVQSVRPGDRVVIANRLTCGQCDYCRRGLDNQCTNYQTIGTTIDGAFAPTLRAPACALWKIDPSVPRDDAALFEPLSCAVGSVKRAPFQPGDNVAIIGAGPMGLLFALLYRTLGAGKIILLDVAPYRLEFAQEMGMDAALNVTQVDAAAEVKRLTGLGADIVVDAVGNQMSQALQLARRGGQVILFGLRPHDNPPVNQYTITRYDLTVHGTFVGLHPFAQTIQLLESRRVQPSVLVTHRLPLAELERGVELMRTQQAMKVLIEM
ncbi:MAG: alcohol dehydrogenase catalytic domain-containing protein [Caldilinea sp.]|nr:alcohol dehydrogenase catalytic domain-containing protein [Caldilineaceae bacterium]MCB9121041.1 alcohol dehydrogenase catalytic domain-containing protein [Caldilineaceae bacterium]MCB9125948.1 alcohol dehydrogenase catalytic domain-containing protein [Caldilineaceae bacterium]MCO5209946.1 alcohol dehydrogenase catalytic domain-containing protein [Caldilinea sp.]MCW5839662.1 alcohol dehydrogenase catalytic domain-containing protein [Caldilinea sp.]